VGKAEAKELRLLMNHLRREKTIHSEKETVSRSKKEDAKGRPRAEEVKIVLCGAKGGEGEASTHISEEADREGRQKPKGRFLY